MSQSRKLKFNSYLRRFLNIFLVLLLLPYWFTNIYDFPSAEPFHGDEWFNPYEGLRGKNWKLGNFHAHANAWFGIMSGTGNNDSMYHAYLNKLNYDLIGISNYESIDERADGFRKIRAYEHGYSPFKYHHIVLGAKEVSWKEYPLWQSIHHKQTMLKHLRDKDENSLIAIAHPKRGNSMKFKDMELLTDYDCVEAFNHLSTSEAHWDAALSSGNPVYLLSDDDTHDHDHIFNTGRLATAIYLPQERWNQDDVLSAIRSGKSYAVEIYTAADETFKRHKQRILDLPFLSYLEVRNDSLFLEFSAECEYVVFIGQNGEEKGRLQFTKGGSYALQKEDSYIRVHAKLLDSHHDFFLNPVMRYDGKELQKRSATVNWLGTITYRIVIGLLLLLIVYRQVKWERKRKSTL